MPQIQEYLPQQEASGPVGGTSPNIELAGSVGRSIERLGNTATEAISTIKNRDAQEETADIYAAFADKRAEYTDRVQQGMQNGSLDVDKIKEQFDDDTQALAENVNTRQGQNYFERQQSRLRGHIVQMATVGKAQLAASEAKGKWRQAVDSTSNTLMRDPSAFQDSYDQALESVDQLIQTGGLPEKYRDDAVRQMGSQFAKSAVRGWADMDPSQAKMLLDKGAFDQFLDGDQKKQMYAEVNHYQQAKIIEGHRAEKTIRDAQKKTQEQWGQQALTQLQDNSLTTKGVLDAVGDGKIDWEHGQRWLTMIKQRQKEDTRTNPAVKNDIISRIVDPSAKNAISDINDVMPYIGHGITINDFNQMNRLIDKTPDGKARQVQEKGLFQAAKSSIRFKNPMTGQYDNLGEQRLNQFMDDYLHAKQSAKPEDLKDMLDPSSSKYFGNQIKNYQTPLHEQMSTVSQDRTDKALGLRKSKENPEGKPMDKNVRQPNESAEAYLKRRGI